MSAPTRAVVAPRALPGALAAELTKLVTLRSTVALLVAVALAPPTVAVLVVATGSLQPDDTVLGASVKSGGVLAQVLASVVGALAIGGEARTGGLAVALTACPRREVLLAAKALVVAGAVTAVSLPAGLVAYGVGRTVLDAGWYAAGDPFPALVGVALLVGLSAVGGLAVGTLVRHTAAAVGAAVALVLVPGMLAPLLGGLRPWVAGLSAEGVLGKLVQSSDAVPDAVGTLGAWPSLAASAVLTGALVVVAVAVLRRWDV